MLRSLRVPQEMSFNELLIHSNGVKAWNDLVLVIEELNGFSKFLLEIAHPTCMNNRWRYHIVSGHRREPELESLFVCLVD